MGALKWGHWSRWAPTLPRTSYLFFTGICSRRRQKRLQNASKTPDEGTRGHKFVPEGSQHVAARNEPEKNE